MNLSNLVQKAVYLGIGVASYAGEKAGIKFGELRVQMQKLADEMVERGEMTTDEARKFVDDMVQNAQQEPTAAAHPEPRKIDIVDDESSKTATSHTTQTPVTPSPTTTSSPESSSDVNLDLMRQQVQDLQDELRRLRKS